MQSKNDAELLSAKSVSETKTDLHTGELTSSVEEPVVNHSEDSLVLNNPESSVDISGLNSDTQTNLPMFVPVRFPVAVEQQYFETLQQFRGNVGRAKNFTEAQRLVRHLEARCLPRLARLKATYGLTSESENVENGGQDLKIISENKSLRPTGPGHMDTIAEEAEQEDGKVF